MDADQPSPSEPVNSAPALPVLDYRTAPRSTEAPHTAFSTIASLWGAIMLVLGAVGTLSTFAHYDTFRRDNEQMWFENELDRRTYEINKLNGVSVGAPPPLFQAMKLHRGMHRILPWFPLVMSVLGAAMLAIARETRHGATRNRARRWVPRLYIVPALFLFAVAGEYQMESWRFFTFEVTFVGWVAAGTLVMALWTQLEMRATAR